MNVVLTGASRGIGYELVKLFLAEGHNVLAISRNKEKLNKLEELGATILAFDLCEESFAPIVDAVSDFGQIDILINNAGALVNKPFGKLTNDDIKYVYNINVFSIIKLTRDLLSSFSLEAHVINISSVGGVQGSVKFPGLSVYSSSKGALTILTECLAEEFKETTYRFNTLALGAVQTEMLEEAFPGYNAKVSASQMAHFIYRFSTEDGKLFNGKTISISSSTP
ncbi:MAG: SDR family oxidoreductase [Flavobacteriales bacterium]|nr:SDR family oxidoreductase [Flavobacteriales bacterium]MBL6872972.1 SDR family oxidoreductase [Flavobacteriales bacterium]